MRIVHVCVCVCAWKGGCEQGGTCTIMTSSLEHLVQLPQIARPESVVIVQQDVEAVAEAG